MVDQGRAQRGVRVQYQDALVIVAQAQLQGRADHPAGLDAPDGGGPEGLRLAGARVEQQRTLFGEGYHLTGGDVGRAADHRRGLAVPQLHGGKGQPISPGVAVDLQHASHDDALPVPGAADLLQPADLRSRHGESMGQLLGGQLDRHVLPEPG